MSKPTWIISPSKPDMIVGTGEEGADKGQGGGGGKARRRPRLLLRKEREAQISSDLSAFHDCSRGDILGLPSGRGRKHLPNPRSVRITVRTPESCHRVVM